MLALVVSFGVNALACVLELIHIVFKKWLFWRKVK